MDLNILAVEIGGTKLQLALGDSSGNPQHIQRGQAPRGRGSRGILDWLDEAMPAFLHKHGAAPDAVGVGFGGPVDTGRGRVVKSFQVEGWQDYPLAAWFEERLGAPVVLCNDTNAAGWGEYCLGTGKGTRSFFYTNIGSGIGGALVLDGRLFDGQGLGGAEMGHTLVPDWTSDTPGTGVRLEDICSGWSIEKRLRSIPALPEATPLHALCEGEPARIDCAMLGEAARQGDAFAEVEIHRVAESIAAAIANVITLCCPERVAVGGGVAMLGPVFFEPLVEGIAARVFEPYRGRYEVAPCALGETIVVRGAMLLASAALERSEAPS